MNITLRQLHAFVLTAQVGSLTRAAERLHLTQSAVSILIKQLETTLGVRLFDRTTRTLRLTAAAEEALPAARRMLRNQEQLLADIRGLTELRRGHVTMAVTPALAAGLMPKVLRSFRAAHPDIALTILDVSPDQLIPRVLDEEVEFSIGTVEGDPANVTLAPLLRDKIGVVFRDDSSLAHRDSLTWEEIVTLPVVAIRKGSGIRSIIDNTLAAKGKVLEPTWEVSLLATALAMVAEGLGVSILPPYIVPRLHLPALTTRPLTDPVVTREISIITKPELSLSCAAESFIEVTRQTIGVQE